MQKTSLFLAITLVITLKTSTTSAHDGAPSSFSAAVDQAWSISRKQPLADQRLAAIKAYKRSNQGWFAGSPELSGNYSSDRLNQDHGQNEAEVEVEVPLWLSGQQAIIAATLDSRYALQQTATQVEKLALAGIVRELYWDAVLKRNGLQSAQSRLAAAESIAKDVQRHIDSGILADADRLLVRVAVLSAEAEQLSAQQELTVAEQSYLARTGQQQTGHWAVETQGRSRAVDAHPLIKNSIAELETTRLEFQRIQIEDREHARLSVGWINERESRDDRSTNRIQIGFSLPLGKERRNRSALAEALAVQLDAEVQLAEQKREVEAKMSIALSVLDSARLHQHSADLSQQISSHRTALDTAAFEAGELGLQAMLASRNHADEARQNWQQRQIEAARSVSNLNQALGYLPSEVVAEGIK